MCTLFASACHRGSALLYGGVNSFQNPDDPKGELSPAVPGMAVLYVTIPQPLEELCGLQFQRLIGSNSWQSYITLPRRQAQVLPIIAIISDRHGSFVVDRDRRRRLQIVPRGHLPAADHRDLAYLFGV